MRKKFWKKLCAGLATLMLVSSFCACNQEKAPQRGKVVFTTGFAKDELFRIGEVSCMVPEYMIYLMNTRNRYEEVFGQEIWDLSFEGVRFEENVRDNVLAKIAQMKSVYLLALDQGIVLSEQEEEKLKQAAEEYFLTLSQEEASSLNVTKDTIWKLYREYTMADKVYKQIIAEVNPEISDDEARTITVEQIVLKTYTMDSQGKQIVYTDRMKAEAYEKIGEIRELATNGENDFSVLAGKYNEEEVSAISFQKGEIDKTIEDVAFQLEKDEISPVIETEKGYYLLKCINTFDREQTEANKLVLIEKRKNEAFGQEYDAFVKKLARKLNEDLWEEMELSQQEIETDCFFEVYEKFFPPQ